ncbi:uracil-DNA glycosylase [Neisseria sp. ZJ106]|uniref:Uracil-DNA glycosylase family protein n=1 Tax=Neisseria lisongii TaxID=2912188 RepID=A0ABY7RLI1_9NEIS|nr:uracil-DNA glycosylase family protein [Neisseria lisongii]MCF7521919.1 uracil-DNA glycosylase [Neisseria lisongii]WCL71120.1 uracil-DNA glycosylase family protein [Neisseria lisongii]
MLSSRYLHLHEALGLGPMWLNRQARFVPSAADTPPPRHPKPAAAAKPATRPTLSALAALNQRSEKNPQTAAPSSELPTQAAATPELPVSAAGIMPSEIMVISICPSTEDSVAGQLFSGAVGVLLDNILAAIGLTPQQAHKTCWIKAAPADNTMPDLPQIEAAAAQIAAELAQSQARAVVFLGQFFQKPQQAAAMQQLCGGLPYIVIPHPARLLRQPSLKADAWHELKKIKALLRNHRP